ncbi:MAG: hypothetical protein JJ894_08715 [Dinoroseobacter sp.]|nr:hypothetical protein [Dinoroseobacter sp.]
MARVNARRVKIHRIYTIRQLADLLEVTVGTVRRWCRLGLPCLTDMRPFLIVGRDFLEFHAEKLARKKTRLKPFEVYCLGCQAARSPQPGLVDAEPMDSTRERIMAICPTCERLTRRIIKRSELRKWGVKYGFAPSIQEHA